VDGQTDMTKIIVDFRNFAKAFKKLSDRMECCLVEYCKILHGYGNMCLGNSQAFRSANTCMC